MKRRGVLWTLWITLSLGASASGQTPAPDVDETTVAVSAAIRERLKPSDAVIVGRSAGGWGAIAYAGGSAIWGPFVERYLMQQNVEPR